MSFTTPMAFDSRRDHLVLRMQTRARMSSQTRQELVERTDDDDCEHPNGKSTDIPG